MGRPIQAKAIVISPLLLIDKLMLNILRRHPPSPYPCSLVCKRWLRLQGSLKQAIKLQEWSFLQSGRMKVRFPNLADVDLTRACVRVVRNGPAIFLTYRGLTIPLSPDVIDMFPLELLIQEHQLSSAALDMGLEALAEGFPGLQRLCVVNVSSRISSKSREWKPEHLIAKGTETVPDGALNLEGEYKKEASEEAKLERKQQNVEAALDNTTKRLSDLFLAEDDFHRDGFEHPIKALSLPEKGLATIAKNCPMLQELKLHQCTDEALTLISGCRNLQIVCLAGSLSENYVGAFTDVGLTILARRCSRLVKLELAGCEASYHGIAAIGQCCIMLEELTLSTDGFQEGWLAALSLCTCLKTLSLENSKQIDSNPGPVEYLGCCPALEQLQLAQCDLRNRLGFGALLSVCRNVRELEFRDCWGLEDENFGLANRCRKVRLLSLEGCSLLTTMGLETVILSWKELQRLRVVCCDNIKDSEISPSLATCFASLKEFKWRPDTKSVLAISLAGTGVGQMGGKFFKKK
ncbi:hypothetical protein O6H91_22G012200 [Diphasiastrum complanatum]|uniref:Uncharacterized protein n=2 Tax=Diphasiastrum complanatum TaxID=34168 RepID=A0ACC2ACX2_DIPCM|nr:hypothetical protein O6H91_22G012200 [Diphasiastrum complanatum]KAJ7515399.1 hypothetical protein O6H91_22G012200 [Diphasiastrum complanatum]